MQVSADIQYFAVSNRVYFLSNNVGIHFVFTYYFPIRSFRLVPMFSGITPYRTIYTSSSKNFQHVPVVFPLFYGSFDNIYCKDQCLYSNFNLFYMYIYFNFFLKMASLAASNWPKPISLIPCLSWSTASVVFTKVCI